MSKKERSLLQQAPDDAETAFKKCISNLPKRSYEINRKLPKVVSLWKKQFVVTGSCHDLFDPSVIHVMIKTNFKFHEIRLFLEGLGFQVMRVDSDGEAVDVQIKDG